MSGRGCVLLSEAPTRPRGICGSAAVTSGKYILIQFRATIPSGISTTSEPGGVTARACTDVNVVRTEGVVHTYVLDRRGFAPYRHRPSALLCLVDGVLDLGRRDRLSSLSFRA